MKRRVTHPHRPPSPPLSLVSVRPFRIVPSLLLLAATACSRPRPASAFTQPDELSALISLRDALRALRGGDVATANWLCDDVSCDPCGDADGDGWGNWRYIGCRQFDGTPPGVVTNVHLTGTTRQRQRSGVFLGFSCLSPPPPSHLVVILVLVYSHEKYHLTPVSTQQHKPPRASETKMPWLAVEILSDFLLLRNPLPF